VKQDPYERDGVFASEIDPAACAVFVIALFVIVPFTLLSPFRYPQPSELDRLLAVNGGPVSQARAVTNPRQFAGRFRAIDLAIASSADSMSPEPTGTVRR
jgi:hypothetical protein